MSAEKDDEVEAEGRDQVAPDRDRLSALLAAQRRLRDARDAEVRGSSARHKADVRLDRVNIRLWHLAATGTMPLDPIGDDMTADIDSIPEDDEGFRSAVVRSIREAITDRVRQDRETRSQTRLDRSARTAGSAMAVIARAQERLRRTYPAAAMVAKQESEDTIAVVAYRDGEVA